MHAIVGLGNPGPEYERTRHNAGFLLAERLAARWSLGPFRRGERARVASGHVNGVGVNGVGGNGVAVSVIKPQTYMNRSGAALAPLRALQGFDPAQHLLVLVDDVALPVGRFRLRGAGTAGGHNGLKSIEGVLQRQDYARLRIGVGPKPPEFDDLADYVLGEFADEEYRVVTDLLDPMADAVECWIAEGIERAMSRFNK